MANQSHCPLGGLPVLVSLESYVRTQYLSFNKILVLFCTRDVKNPDVFSSENSWEGLPKFSPAILPLFGRKKDTLSGLADRRCLIDGFVQMRTFE